MNEVWVACGGGLPEHPAYIETDGRPVRGLHECGAAIVRGGGFWCDAHDRYQIECQRQWAA